MGCAVLSYRVVLADLLYCAMFQRGAVRYAATHLLRGARYWPRAYGHLGWYCAICGTELGYGATHSLRDVRYYALCSTGFAYAATHSLRNGRY
eukprot:2612853-Rhodomonas_salina.1